MSATLPVQISSILVVDDSVVQRAFAVDICRKLGIPEIHQADNGESAMTLLHGLEKLPEVAILDLEMPVVDGVELAQRMHDADMLMPLVIASARDISVIEGVVRLVAAFGFPILGGLQKPLTMEKLAPALADFEPEL